MATPQKELLDVDGHEVAISNPDKPYFAAAGHRKIDVVRYYLAVADGALRGAGGRPNVLKRYPDGAEGEYFYQKRAPTPRPPWIDAVTLAFPSGRTAEEVVPHNAAGLAWMVNLGCLELHPHPVRADDLDHPDELRLDLDPMPGVTWPDLVAVATECQAALPDYGLIGWPKTSGSRGIHIIIRIERRWTFDQVRRSALAFAREIERRMPGRATSKWWKEEREGVFLDYNQNAKDRTVASAYSVRPRPDARVSAPLAWDELAACDPADFTLVTMPARFAALGDRHAGIDDRACSLDGLLELAARHEAEGHGDAPWPPHFAKQDGEPPRVQPSKRRAPAKAADAVAAAGDGADGAGSVAPAPAPKRARRRNPAITADASADGSTVPPPSGSGRRQSKFPLLEIARAVDEADARAGLERWKARHPEAAALLAPIDILVDGMRGRFRTWTRIRLNLRNVPEALRPAPEPLDPDDDISAV